MTDESLTELQKTRLKRLDELEATFEPFYYEFKKTAETFPIVASGELFKLIVEFAKLRTPEGHSPRNHTMGVFTELIVRVRGNVPYEKFIADIRETILRPGTPYDVTLVIDGVTYHVEVKSSISGDFLCNFNQVEPGCPAETIVTADIRNFELILNRIECLRMRNTHIEEARKKGHIKEPDSINYKGKKKVIEKEDLKPCPITENHPVTKKLKIPGMSAPNDDNDTKVTRNH